MVVEVRREILGDNHLIQCAGAAVALQRQQTAHDVPACDDVAKPQCRGERLRKRTNMNDAAGIERIERRWCLDAVPQQVSIAFVLKDRDVVFAEPA